MDKLLKPLIVQELINKENHLITYSRLKRKMWNHFDMVSEIDEAVKMLKDADIISVYPELVEEQIVIHMTEKQVKEWNEYFQKKREENQKELLNRLLDKNTND